MRKLTAILVTLLVGATAGVRADDRELEQALDDASRDLAQGEWRDAQDELKKARKDLNASKNAELRAKYGFYLALVNDRRSADLALKEPERTKARDAAMAGYEEYLKAHPDAGGALNNLAQLYAQDPARRADALALYDRAVALKDVRADVYALNRARLQIEMGNAEAAYQYSEEAWKKDPGNAVAQRLTLSLLESRRDPEALARHVQELNGAGQVNRAIETAMGQIRRLSAKREPLLVALVESLANPKLTDLPEDFLASDTARALREQTSAADIGAGVRELLELYGNPAELRGGPWWRRDFREGETKPGWFRGDAFLDLARALGDRCRRAGVERYPCAERYYQFALEFSFSPDPNSFLGLAQMYASTNRIRDLERLSDHYVPQLFSGKGAAIARGDKLQQFEFHLALGTMYAYLEEWQNPEWSPASAIYQLENAQRSAEDYNRRNPQAEPVQFPAESALLLSDAYVKTGQVDKAAKLRVTTAEKALDQGDKRGATVLVNQEWRASLPQSVEREFAGRMDTIDRKVRL